MKKPKARKSLLTIAKWLESRESAVRLILKLERNIIRRQLRDKS